MSISYDGTERMLALKVVAIEAEIKKRAHAREYFPGDDPGDQQPPSRPAATSAHPAGKVRAAKTANAG